MTNYEWRMTNRIACGRRRWLACLAVAGLVCTVSCARSLRNPFSSMGPPSPEVLAAGSSLAQVVAAVNQNSQKIVSYQTNNATITIPGSLGIPSLRGNIAAMRPGRVRLQASTSLTGPEVDLGSNEELFWFWVKRNEPPAVYFARHSQRAGSAAQQLMPIEPQWLLDALGMAELKLSDRHEGPLPGRDNNTIEITSNVQSQNGPLTKRTVLHATKALILEQHLYDGAGTLLASAVARSHRYYAAAGVSLPQEVEIRIPPAELAMTIDVGTVELNRLADAPAMWAMPIIQGSAAVDLGIAPPSAPGGGAPTLGAQINDADWYNPAPATGAPTDMVAVRTGAPPVATQPLGTTLPAGGVPAPLFIPPSGAAAPATEPALPPAALSSQRLPSSGIVAPSPFTR
jgi:hypothetical protein